jgi:hypothetical protein
MIADSSVCFPLINLELWLKHSNKQNLTDQYLQTWLSSVNDSPKALNYRIYKDNLVFENYLNILNDKDNLTWRIVY